MTIAQYAGTKWKVRGNCRVAIFSISKYFLSVCYIKSEKRVVKFFASVDLEMVNSQLQYHLSFKSATLQLD